MALGIKKDCLVRADDQCCWKCLGTSVQMQQELQEKGTKMVGIGWRGENGMTICIKMEKPEEDWPSLKFGKALQVYFKGCARCRESTCQSLQLC